MDRKKSSAGAKEKGTRSDSPPVLPSKKIIGGKDGMVQTQYPAKVGYHGTDNEKDLSPEE